MTKITHVINWHIHRNLFLQAWNLIPKLSRKKVYKYKFKFTESCKYCESELNQAVMGDDCKDWNKLLGISFFPAWNARRNSVMLGWRHTPENGIEVQPYLHALNGDNIYKLYQSLTLEIDIDYIVEINLNTHKLKVYREDQKPLPGLLGATFVRWDLKFWGKVFKPTWIRRQINSWFGGNQTAPQTMSLYVKRLKN